MTCAPVSYTHLDVYKRQYDMSLNAAVLTAVEEGQYTINVSNSVLLPMGKPPIEGTVDALTIAPVSYTHLDVYKRQISSC